MPNLKYILELKSRTERALNAEPPDGLTAFSLSWALWEAVRRRVLLLACKREGWTVEQARKELFKEPVDNERFLELYTAVTSGTRWEDSLPLAAGKLWPEILEAAQLRKRIIHGTTRIGEGRLQGTAWNVLRFVNRLREHPVGDPLETLSARAVKTVPDQSLQERLRGTGGNE